MMSEKKRAVKLQKYIHWKLNSLSIKKFRFNIIFLSLLSD